MKGASRTPADELPIMAAAFFISSEKCANRMEGSTRKRSFGRASIAAKMSVEPGSLLGAMRTKLRPDAVMASKRARACAPIVSDSDVTGWKIQMPNSPSGSA